MNGSARARAGPLEPQRKVPEHVDKSSQPLRSYTLGNHVVSVKAPTARMTNGLDERVASLASVPGPAELSQSGSSRPADGADEDESAMHATLPNGRSGLDHLQARVRATMVRGQSDAVDLTSPVNAAPRNEGSARQKQRATANGSKVSEKTSVSPHSPIKDVNSDIDALVAEGKALAAARAERFRVKEVSPKATKPAAAIAIASESQEPTAESARPQSLAESAEDRSHKPSTGLPTRPPIHPVEDAIHVDDRMDLDRTEVDDGLIGRASERDEERAAHIYRSRPDLEPSSGPPAAGRSTYDVRDRSSDRTTRHATYLVESQDARPGQPPRISEREYEQLASVDDDRRRPPSVRPSVVVEPRSLSRQSRRAIVFDQVPEPEHRYAGRPSAAGHGPRLIELDEADSRPLPYGRTARAEAGYEIYEREEGRLVQADASRSMGDELDDWLDLTGWYDLPYRRAALQRRRRRLALEMKRAELEREEQLALEERAYLVRLPSAAGHDEHDWTSANRAVHAGIVRSSSLMAMAPPPPGPTRLVRSASRPVDLAGHETVLSDRTASPRLYTVAEPSDGGHASRQPAVGLRKRAYQADDEAATGRSSEKLIRLDSRDGDGADRNHGLSTRDLNLTRTEARPPTGPAAERQQYADLDRASSPPVQARSGARFAEAGVAERGDDSAMIKAASSSKQSSFKGSEQFRPTAAADDDAAASSIAPRTADVGRSERRGQALDGDENMQPAGYQAEWRRAGENYGDSGSAGSGGLAESRWRGNAPSYVEHGEGRPAQQGNKANRGPNNRGPIPMIWHRDTRFFVLKSFCDENVELALRESIWVTQQKNAEMFREAFHGSPHVMLVFSVNKSVAFQGYARMESAPGTAPMPAWTRQLHWKSSGAFHIRWISVAETHFSRIGHLKNSYNEGKPVFVARDGQELERRCGAALCESIDEECDRTRS